MKKCANWITNHSLGITIASLILLVPAIWGYVNTKINYDILVYLPEDIETIEGQNILTEKFGIGAFSFVMVDNMTSRDILKLQDEIKKINGVEQVASIANITDTAIPISVLPDDIIEKVYHEKETVIVVTFKNSISDENTIDAVKTLRSTVKDASTVSGMTAMVLDTMDLSNEEIVAYIIIAASLCIIVLLLATEYHKRGKLFLTISIIIY